MFDGGLFCILVFVVESNGENHNLGRWVHRCFLAGFEEVIEIGSGIAVQLDLWVGVGWDSVDVGVPQNEDRFFAPKEPVL